MKDFFKKIDWKYLIKIIVITILIGSLFGIFIITNKDTYMILDKPINVPPVLFGIVWTILYILMGISIYRITQTDSNKKGEAKLIYFIQLVVNALWTPIFFGLNEYFLAFLWIIMLILLVITMIISFFKIDKISAYLNIPYLLWLLFAAYLNFGIFALN